MAAWVSPAWRVQPVPRAQPEPTDGENKFFFNTVEGNATSNLFKPDHVYFENYKTYNIPAVDIYNKSIEDSYENGTLISHDQMKNCQSQARALAGARVRYELRVTTDVTAAAACAGRPSTGVVDPGRGMGPGCVYNREGGMSGPSGQRLRCPGCRRLYPNKDCAAGNGIEIPDQR